MIGKGGLAYHVWMTHMFIVYLIDRYKDEMTFSLLTFVCCDHLGQGHVGTRRDLLSVLFSEQLFVPRSHRGGAKWKTSLRVHVLYWTRRIGGPRRVCRCAAGRSSLEGDRSRRYCETAKMAFCRITTWFSFSLTFVQIFPISHGPYFH